MSVVADGGVGPRVQATDGHQWTLLVRQPTEPPRMRLLWLPALGVAARHYLPFAEALAARGVAVYLHEWRGNGSSSLRPSHTQDWGYRELLELDLPASIATLPANALPVRLGGHSLGGQLACCYAGQHPEQVGGLWLVGSGTPYWRSFPAPRRWLLPPLYRFLPWLARRRGALHGRRIGFGGNESRGLIADWARVGLTGIYTAAGLDQDLEAGMALVTAPARGVVLAGDWMAPCGSLQALLDKLPQAPRKIMQLQAGDLQAPADHFAWMKHPDAVVAALLDDRPTNPGAGTD